MLRSNIARLQTSSKQWLCLNCQLRRQHAAPEPRQPERRPHVEGYRQGRVPGKHPPRAPRTYVSRDRQEEKKPTIQLEFMKAGGPRPQPPERREELPQEKELKKERAVIDLMLRGRREDIMVVAEVHGKRTWADKFRLLECDLRL